MGEAHAVDGGQGKPGSGVRPGVAHWLLDAWVVPLEKQPVEEHSFGPAVPLVAEWRKLRTGGAQVVCRVDRAVAAVRRWELEVKMLRDFLLTLPPETEQLDASRERD